MNGLLTVVHEWTRGFNAVLLIYLLVLLSVFITEWRYYARFMAYVAAPLVAAAATMLSFAVVTLIKYGIVIPVFGPDFAGQFLPTLIFMSATALCGSVMVSYLYWRTGEDPEIHVRGAVLTNDVADLKATRRVKRKYGNGVLTLAGIALPPADEPLHFKLIGATGAGKSTAIRELLDAALARGDRAIIADAADPQGGYLSRYYDADRGDKVLSPFHPLSAAWDLFAEIREPYDIDQVVRALISEGDGNAVEWRAYARTFVSAIIRRCRNSGQTNLAELWRLIAIAGSDELRTAVADTPAAPFLEEKNAKMFGSIRSVAAAALTGLEYLKDQAAAPLSVRTWIKEGQGALFLPYEADQIPTLATSISAWMRLAIVEAMKTPRPKQRLWFIVDELDALGEIDGLKDALVRLRKFGGRCVLGFQSIAQVSAVYGEDDAQTIVENCANTLILRCSASRHGGTSEFASRLIGDREVLRIEHSSGTSRGGMFSDKDTTYSSNSSQRRVTERVIMPSEIEQLPNLQGYLKIASSPAWRTVTLDPV